MLEPFTCVVVVCTGGALLLLYSFCQQKGPEMDPVTQAIRTVVDTGMDVVSRSDEYHLCPQNQGKNFVIYKFNTVKGGIVDEYHFDELDEALARFVELTIPFECEK
jgi:hypothetical protein